MSETARVLLITGPSGSGKSTLGQTISEKLGWQFICEDDFWAQNGWVGRRTDEQEREVQAQVNEKLLELKRSGMSAVLEFIIYKDPPNALSNYQKMLKGDSMRFTTVVLKPTIDEIMNRIKERGRPDDIEDIDSRRGDAEQQVDILKAEYIKPEWVIDPTGMTVDALYDACVSRLPVEGESIN